MQNVPVFQSNAMMIDDRKIDGLIRDILAHLPEGMTQLKEDFRKNLKSAVQAGLARMDLVTREEFDVQAELLARTRALLDAMEKRLAALERALSGKDASR